MMYIHVMICTQCLLTIDTVLYKQTYSTAQRQIDARMWVSSWPTTNRPANGRGCPPISPTVTSIGHPQLRTCNARLDTSRTVFKINYCSPLHGYQHSVLYIHTSIVNPRVNSK